MKRTVDIVVGAALCAVAVPVVVVAALVITVLLRCSPFFVQDRIGADGRRFRFVKLRTLPPDVDPYADKYALDDVDVPRFCTSLRRLHLDELPQLALVVTGRMSLVGPRPEMPRLHEELDPAFAAARTGVRPGCTGLWQVGDQCDLLIGEAPEFDELYLRHRSLRLDAWILWRTAVMIVVGRTVPLDRIPLWALRGAPLGLTPARAEP